MIAAFGVSGVRLAGITGMSTWDGYAAAMEHRDKEARRRRRARFDAADAALALAVRLNGYLGDADNRNLLTFAELKVLGAASDVLSAISGRLRETDS